MLAAGLNSEAAAAVLAGAAASPTLTSLDLSQNRITGAPLLCNRGDLI
jgi:hypothetical protein